MEFRFDGSGLTLAYARGADHRPVVVHVQNGSPAFEEGLRERDVIVGVDLRPAQTIALDELRRILQRPGVRYRLTLLRDGQTSEVVITTRRLI